MFTLFALLTVSVLTLGRENEFILLKSGGQRQEISNDLLQSETRIDQQADIFRKRLDLLKEGPTKEIELVFIIDASSSVGEENFHSELRFARKLVADFIIGPNATRVAVVTFATEIVTYVNHLDQGIGHEKCSLLHKELPQVQYMGGNTFTLGALQEAALILNQSRIEAKKAVFLITDGFSNNGDPTLVAAHLKSRGVKIFTFGIQSGNIEELYRMSSPPAEEHAFLLRSFSEFEALARRALHQDLAQGVYIPVAESSSCSSLCNQTQANCCNENATCSCGTLTGHFGCLCPPGYYGSGIIGEPCSPCPKGTYNDGKVPGDSSVCRSCPDRNQKTKRNPATSISDCICKDGFVPVGEKCEVITCPGLKPPKNGYFVKENCSNVLNAACGVRCDIGYELTGSSVRICQKNATWTGNAPVCNPRKCAALKPVHNGEVHCSHEDEGFEILITYGDYGEKKSEVVKRRLANNEKKRAREPVDTFIVDTECRFGCSVGYSLLGSKLRTCLPVTRWDGLQATCKPITCPSIPKLSHGLTIPENCTKSGLKHSYGAICNVSCEPGFTLKGNNTRHCTGKHGTWSGKAHPYKCIDTEAPQFTCPPNMTITTDAGSPFASINLSLPNAMDNSGIAPILWTKPPILESENPKLSIGSAEIQVLGVDASGNLASCSFWITVEDNEKPHVENCESPEPMSLVTLIELDWEEPQFYDNSGIVNVTRSHEIKVLTNGTTIVNYKAVDQSGNEAFCRVNLTLLDNVCTLPPTPHNADVNCSSNDTETYCHVFCKPGFFSHVPNATLTCKQARWTYESTSYPVSLPDCSEIVSPDEIIRTGQIIIETDETLCDGDLDELSNDLSRIGAFYSRGVELKLECLEENSNVVWNPQNQRKKRSRIRPRRMNFQLKSRFTDDMANPQFMHSDEISSRETARNDNMSVVYQGKTLKIKSFETKGVVFKCNDGSIAIMDKCVKCALGHYFNSTTKSCDVCPRGSYQDQEGQKFCISCQEKYSTLHIQSKSLFDCKRVCPPGTYGKKTHSSGKALSPCFQCPTGQFQVLEGQSQCQPCGTFFNSSQEQCPNLKNTCTPLTCKNNGICLSEPALTCLCTEGFLGAFCDKIFNPCDSGPCLHGGTCRNTSLMHFECDCSSNYQGHYCELEVDFCLSQPCANGARCSSTANGFHCECTEGYNGETCSEVIDTCKLTRPCQNNSTCTNGNNDFKCTCHGEFSGRFCERSSACLQDEELLCTNTTATDKSCLICPDGYDCNMTNSDTSCLPKSLKPAAKIQLDSVLIFPKCSSTDYMVVDLALPQLEELSACLWVRTVDSFNFGTLFSYANGKIDNEFTLTDYNGFVLYVHGQRVVTDVVANDGFWHFICVTWKSEGGSWRIYVDGKIAAYGRGLSSGYHFEGNGTLVVGQEQDFLGGGFNEAESFVGTMTLVEIWAVLLSHEEISLLANSCSIIETNRNLGLWKKLLENMRGNIQVLPSSFCQSCGPAPSIFRASIATDGKEARYQCNSGFLMKFPKEETTSSTPFWIRKCLKTGEWEPNPPICARVSCGSPGFLLHGNIIGRSHQYEDIVRYQCHEGYTLVGPSRRRCLEKGEWSEGKPKCQGRGMCQPLTAPRRGALFLLSVGSAPAANASVGDRVEFTCDLGYHLHGAAVLTCMQHGGWDHEPPVCLSCPTPTVPSLVTWKSGDHPDVINITCTTTGETASADCLMGDWNVPRDFCAHVREKCPIPRPPRHGFLLTHSRLLEDKFAGDMVRFGCRHGYQLSEGANVIICSQELTWNVSDSSCLPVPCNPPALPAHTQSLDDTITYKYNDVINYRCLPGYHNLGTLSIRCEAEGVWSKLRGRCIRVICEKPSAGLRWSDKRSSFSFEDILDVVCPNGVRQNLKCQADGTWSSANCNHLQACNGPRVVPTQLLVLSFSPLMEMFNFQGTKISFSGTNPFDRSYHPLQRRYDMKIADLLCTIMNATMEVISSPLITDLAVYERNPNAWVVEQLVKGSAEISSTSLVLTPDSENLVDYSVAIGTFRPQIFFKAQSVRMANNIYFIPFSVDTWIALLCILLIITVVLTIILARETRLPHSTPYDLIARIADEKHDKGLDWNKIEIPSTSNDSLLQREHWEISEILLVSIGALCQQGSERDPNTAAARTLLLALFVLAVLIYTAYSASVISLISLLPNTDVELHMGWAAAKNSQIILQDTNFFKYSFEKSRGEVLYMSLKDGLTEVLENDAAFLADRDVTLTTLHQLRFHPDLRCSLARAFPGLEYKRVFALRNKSPYLAPLNYNILRLRQYGLISREQNKIFDRRKPCSTAERAALSGFVSVDLSDTFPALILLMWGCILAIIILILEYLIFCSSLEVKKIFGDSYKKVEKQAGEVLNRWLRIQLYDAFRKKPSRNDRSSPLKPLPPFIK